MSARAWVAFAAVSTLWGIPYLTPAAALAPPAANPSGAAVVSPVVLGLFCTAAAFAFYGALVAEARRARSRSPKHATQQPAPPSLEPATRALPCST